ncbi:hypothetical protein LTR10_018932 [Elasticomyces elasticus]|uniref:DUF202 domain-containing protein n=1 Tax=Exophiala sideris TaxID=1016849 RepID=A0A0D1VYV2_9EURO|nr:hypothetical protein LTR10_018932 [Elasticomyces elasticus]KIV81570.1 hypothetical protein PV11_03745 [Exophiala sideris]
MPVSVAKHASSIPVSNGQQHPAHHPDGHEQHELKDLRTAQSPQNPPGIVDDSSITSASTRGQHRQRSRIRLLSRSRYVPIPAARDHLANERVFLAYIRTSSAFANFAVAILQLYRLKHSSAPPGKLGDYDLGVPLATATLVIAIIVAITGAARFFICEDAMLQKRIVGSGSVVVILIAVTSLLLLVLFIFTIIVNPDY